MQELDLLILGAGWTGSFLIPLCQSRKVPFAATTTTGRKVAGHSTIPWKFDPEDKSDRSYADLPLAKHVLIVFPLTGNGQSKLLASNYTQAHKRKLDDVNFVQLGSTGIWQIEQKTLWVSRRSPYNRDSPRAIAEDELLSLGGCVLNLAGLWGGERDPKLWVDRVATTKEQVKSKKSLHMVHGTDVARAILAIVGCDWASKAKGQRWMLTDGFVYDWYSLFAGWANVKNVDAEAKVGELGLTSTADPQPTNQARWVFELMVEERIWALPRSMEALGRCYFGREFWDTFELAPLKARI